METLQATVYTVEDKSNLFFWNGYKVIEIPFWHWLSLRRLMTEAIVCGEAPHFDKDDVLIVNQFVAPGRDQNVWITGNHSHHVLQAMIEYGFEIIEEDKEEGDFLREYFYAESNPNNEELYKAKASFNFKMVHPPRSSEPLPINFLQLSALNRFASRNLDVKILGKEIMGDALFVQSFGMTVGIEPDGYTHS